MTLAPLFARPLRTVAALLAPLVLVAALWQPAAAARAQQSDAEGAPQLDLPRTVLTIGMYRLDTQVATTAQTRETGLMFRRQMPDYEAMLFVFERPGVQCFWMKNTRLPLTAAFLDDDGKIVNLADMAPMTEDNHCSARPVRYVLEVNQGWFAQRHIRAGAKFKGAAFEQ